MGLFSRNQSNKSSANKKETAKKSGPDYISPLLEPKSHNTNTATTTLGDGIPLGYDETLGTSVGRSEPHFDTDTLSEQEQFEQALSTDYANNAASESRRPLGDDTFDYLFDDDSEDPYEVTNTPGQSASPHGHPVPHHPAPQHPAPQHPAPQHPAPQEYHSPQQYAESPYAFSEPYENGQDYPTPTEHPQLAPMPYGTGSNEPFPADEALYAITPDVHSHHVQPQWSDNRETPWNSQEPEWAPHEPTNETMWNEAMWNNPETQWNNQVPEYHEQLPEYHEPPSTQHSSNPAMMQEHNTIMSTPFNFQHEQEARPNNNVGVFSRNRGQGGTLTPHEPGIRNAFSQERPSPVYEGNLPSLPSNAPNSPYAQPQGSNNQNLSTNRTNNTQPATTMTQNKTALPANATHAQRMKYGISEAIKLLRQLPETGDVTVLMTIVKRTLETTGINVQDIIRDAQIKKRDIQSRVHQLEGEIRKLETQVRTRNAEIETLNSEFAETEQVQELLELAEMPAPTKFTRDDADAEDLVG